VTFSLRDDSLQIGLTGEGIASGLLCIGTWATTCNAKKKSVEEARTPIDALLCCLCISPTAWQYAVIAVALLLEATQPTAQ
jgi:hypothetical protein